MPAARLLALDRAATVGGVALLGVAALVAPLLAGIDGMRADACARFCRADLVGAGSGVIALGPAVCLTAVIVLVLALRRPERLLSWIGLLGLVATIGTLVLGDAIISAGNGG